MSSSSTCLKLQVSGGISTIFSIFFLSYITWKGLCALRITPMISFFKIMFIIDIFTAWLILFCYLSFMSIACFNLSMVKLIYNLASFFYFCIQFPLLLIICTARLHVFDTSVYRVNGYILRSFYMAIALIISFNFVYFAFFINYDIFGRNFGLYSIRVPILICGLALYLILACILVATFIQKLNRLIIAQNESRLGNSVSFVHNDVRLSWSQTQMIEQVSKYLVASCFAFFTTFLSLSMIGMMTVLSIDAFDDDIGLQASISPLIGLFDTVCNTICLYLQFKFSSEDYYRLCGYCDSICKKFIVKRVKKSVSVESDIYVALKEKC